MNENRRSWRTAAFLFEQCSVSTSSICHSLVRLDGLRYVQCTDEGVHVNNPGECVGIFARTPPPRGSPNSQRSSPITHPFVHPTQRTSTGTVDLIHISLFLDPRQVSALAHRSRPGIWQIIRQDAASSSGIVDDEEPFLPVYEEVSKQSTSLSPVRRNRYSTGLPPDASPISIPNQSFLNMEPLQETLTYSYSLHVGDAPVQISILIDAETDRPNYYSFSLTIKVGPVERALCKPLALRLSVDPRKLEFSVFLFPPRSCLPTGCLHHLRVWLRSAGIDHRIFSEDDLWIGRDPDFRSIGDASFAILRNATQDMLIYQVILGRAHVSFIVRWRSVEAGVYALSLDYDAGGVGRTLFDECYLRLDCDPQTVSFVIYSIPAISVPNGASHRLRFWIRTPCTSVSPTSSISSQHVESYNYQRLWKSDDFKLGALLDFAALGPKLLMAVRNVNSPQSEHEQPIGQEGRHRRSRLPPIPTSESSGVSDR